VDHELIEALARAEDRIALLEARLREQATHDQLTGLPNQVVFAARLEEAMAQAEAERSMVAVGFLDLDRFRTVNDVLGHAAGDQLLQQVAGRLSALLGRTNVYRMAGDEFVLLRERVHGSDDHVRVFESCARVLQRPFVCEGQELYMTASIGIALYPFDGEEVGTLVRNADCAMFRAKERGGDTVECYSRGLFEEARRRLSLERSLRLAIDSDEILLVYQPQFDLANGEIVGIEALARWRHPELGLLAPDAFMPLAEETGLVIPIGERILEMASGQARRWAAIDPGPRVWVNLSARQFHQSDLPALVAGMLERTGLAPTQLGVEITESTAMRHPVEAGAVLGRLASLGVKAALDDFGTGYSSLAYLSRFPIDVLKLDRSFVQTAPSDSNDATIARAVISLAHGLGITVVAEGVETPAQQAFLIEEGCDHAQGFLLGRPMPPAVLTPLLLRPALQVSTR
jgi:diguanylate cyclase (GGDEF)-like protein